MLIAHRGASSEAPENTLAAIRRALEIGVDAIEIDVHLTADGHLVAIHDAAAGRTAWGAAGKRISDMGLAEVKTLDAGSWFGSDFAGERIPTLAEILTLDRKGAGLMIEIKRGHLSIEQLAQTVVETLAEASQQDSLIVGSFSVALLERIHALNPKLSLIGIVEDQKFLNSFEALKPARMALWYKLATPSVVANFQEKGQPVWTFTVDDPRTAQFLTAIGVAGIITNQPGALKL